MSDTSVVFNVLARDRASRVFGKIRKAALDGSSGIVAALGPALLPTVAAATAGIVGFGAAVTSAGAAVGVYGAVFGSAFGEVKEASDKTADLTDKITLLNEQIKVAKEQGDESMAGRLELSRAKAVNELTARYNLMPPALRRVTQSYDGMKMSWQDFVNKNKPQVYATMTSGFNSLTTIIPKLQPLFDLGSAAAARFVGWLGQAANGGGIDRFINFLVSQGGPALDKFAAIGRNVFTTIGAAARATVPAGQGMLDWLVKITDKAATWSQGGGFERFMGYVSTQGPGVVSTLGSLATSIGHIAQAVTPLAPVSLAVAKALGAIIAAIPPPVLTALVATWIAYSVALKGYRAVVTAVGIATKGAAAAQAVWNAAQLAANFTRATAQIAAFVAKQAALKVATLASAAAQGVWNAAIIAANFARASAQIAAFYAKQLLISAATKAWAAVQWVLNLAMWASPITWIVVGIIALIAIIVLIATKTDWFSKIWNAAWGWIKRVAGAAWDWIKAKTSAFWGWIKSVPGWIRDRWNSIWGSIKTNAGNAWNWIKTKVAQFYTWITGLPGKVSNKLSSMFNGLWTGFKSVANRIIAGWNRLQFTIGGGSFAGVSIPSVTLGTPNIPYLAKGGNIQRSGTAVVGERGPELVSLSRGAQVTPLTGARGAAKMALEIDLRGADQEFARMFLKLLRNSSSMQSTMRQHLGIKAV
ncbi:hypothetical protein OHA21_43860 [Actinoplanes sp. NBC_00393]|uniref:hypothetical protein n=1 Tax=Actinoplanes sp. NBC_00393 TaxID=2975953 RepID=UPI002E2492D3